MHRLEDIRGDAWRDVIASPRAVLVLGKSDCEACRAWTAALERFLAADDEFSDVRFGKIVLDQGGLSDFKRANAWIAELDTLPFTQLYVDGQPGPSFVGGGIERLTNRLRRASAPAPAGDLAG
jgi:hypothetical protein